ncbi:hypothetical protein RAJCM14343_3086 [Rhodococcus aetherivorans]|uniref:Uncharacterized protein n=1 Tax=Rhodococcus aetherivorans TaxID=191292 RepID=A0ABQ0YMW1_9NOCA|nr:hypothetical protein RAJCM14343_3086 [Rhodococcus aetherivorans]
MQGFPRRPASGSSAMLIYSRSISVPWARIGRGTRREEKHHEQDYVSRGGSGDRHGPHDRPRHRCRDSGPRHPHRACPDRGIRPAGGPRPVRCRVRSVALRSGRRSAAVRGLPRLTPGRPLVAASRPGRPAATRHPYLPRCAAGISAAPPYRDGRVPRRPVGIPKDGSPASAGRPARTTGGNEQ